MTKYRVTKYRKKYNPEINPRLNYIVNKIHYWFLFLLTILLKKRHIQALNKQELRWLLGEFKMLNSITARIYQRLEKELKERN